ncbi:hypothetical protein [Sphingomonas sp. UNC305MFCol5.2]|uniref:hypothetical protein n=1 Tax=Sphingomonas sp. UNC305MFCol5.2 TaxID=1449076 RepID=UPI000407DEC9|nr:hypothetical protein [Sphingomonas sp. UNC305MFCol5.2]
MKNSILAVAVVVAATAALPAAAQSASATGTVTVNGSVADRCQFTTPSAVINAGELALQGSGSTAGKLDTSKLDGQTRTLVGWCNGTAASMSVEAQPLVDTTFVGAAPTGFDSVVNYSASALANSATASDTSMTAGAGTAVPVGLFTGNVVVTLAGSSSPTGGILVAGSYSGQVLVTLTPNVSLPLSD